MLLDVLTRTLDALADEGVSAALLGGLAVSAWAEPRFTRDVDLAVAVDSDAEAERLVHALSGHAYRLRTTVEQTAKGRMATARMLPPGEVPDGVVVDPLFASSGIEPEIVAAAPMLDIGAARPVPVARVGHLVALKLLAQDPSRPHDTLDLHALRALIDVEEAERARSACALITRRGYARGKDLTALLHAFLA